MKHNTQYMIFDYRGMTGKRLETRLFAQSLKTLMDAFVDFDLVAPYSHPMHYKGYAKLIKVPLRRLTFAIQFFL